MERVMGWVRQTRMMDIRPLRGLAGRRGLLLLGAGLLCAALAGCGSVVASSGPAAAPAALAAGVAAATQVGCASVNQATAVDIHRETGFVKTGEASLADAARYRKAARVRALFGQLCAAVTHPTKALVMRCPAHFGTSYFGTFYDGSRVLATFIYDTTGCPRVAVTAAGKTLATRLYGSAAAAAPHLVTDLEAIVGPPEPGLVPPQGTGNPGGPA